MEKIASFCINHDVLTKGMYVSNYILSTFLSFESEMAKNIARGLEK